MRTKRIYDIVKEKGIGEHDYYVAVYTKEGNYIGKIEPVFVHNIGNLLQLQARYLSNGEHGRYVIEISEYDNIREIEWIYHEVAHQKQLIWEENSL